jgi:hypothetical protein
MKKQNQSDVKRMRQLAGRDYASFYKLAKEVNVRQSFVAMGKLYVIHETGQFAFPIRNIVNPETDKKIREMFFTLLNLPVAVQKQTAA